MAQTSISNDYQNAYTGKCQLHNCQKNRPKPSTRWKILISERFLICWKTFFVDLIFLPHHQLKRTSLIMSDFVLNFFCANIGKLERPPETRQTVFHLVQSDSNVIFICTVRHSHECTRTTQFVHVYIYLRDASQLSAQQPISQNFTQLRPLVPNFTAYSISTL